MKIAAVISEYNPYHNGHSHLINEARKVASFDACISVMSGNFVQRGECAIYNKYLRAKLSVLNEIDLVLELPVCYSTGSAGDFALGAVSLLNKLGSIDYLIFGVEEINSDLIHELTDILQNEPSNYKEQLNESLKKGLSFAAARQAALEAVCGKDLNNYLGKPNNILAIEYFLAIKKLGSNITPIVVKRSTDNYHNAETTGSLSSATAIRNIIYKHPDYISNYNISECLSNATLNELSSNNFAKPIFENDISSFIRNKLLNITNEELEKICDCTPDLSNRLINTTSSSPYLNYTELIAKLESKNITNSRIRRVILHLLFNYYAADHQTFITNGIAYYANILALRKDNTSVLREIAKHTLIPIINKKADFKELIENHKDFNETDKLAAVRMWELDLLATKLYNMIYFEKYNEILPDDYTYKFYI